jgi:hypothetical protein
VRAEDVGGVSFFAVLISGVVVAISGSRTSLTPRQRALWRGWGLSMIGGALIVFGVVNFAFIHNSARPVVEGNLWDIRELYSSRAQSSLFRITDASGHAVQIRCKYTGPGLVQGERARVRYVTYNEKLVEMEMLSGPFQGWRFEESSGEAGWWWWVAMGVGCGFFAYRQRARSRMG